MGTFRQMIDRPEAELPQVKVIFLFGPLVNVRYLLFPCSASPRIQAMPKSMGGGLPRLFVIFQLFADQANFVGPRTRLYIRPEFRIRFGNSGQADSVLFNPVIKRATR